MSRTALYTETKDRLKQYGLFSNDTLAAVAAVAEKQAAEPSYEAFFASVYMPAPILYTMKQRRWSVPVVDIPPKGKAKGVIVVHLPMVNPLDENQRYHIATLAAVFPKHRVIGFGNPSGNRHKFKGQNRGLHHLFAIAFTRHRRSLVAPEIEYLYEQGINAAHHVGYSYGAHKALIEASYLPSSALASLVLIDPVAHPRTLRQLVSDFRRTLEPLGKYVNRTKIKAYCEARAVTAANAPSDMDSLLRPISIAIAILMARLDFIPFLKSVRQKHPRLPVAVAWGSNSELGNDAHMATSLATIEGLYPLRLNGDTHAFANDIHLFAAIIYESLAHTR